MLAHFTKRVTPGKLANGRPLPASRRPVVSVAATAVVFKCQHHVYYGESLLLVGNEPALGAWNPASALELYWTDGDVWTSELELPNGSNLEYKFIIKRRDGVEWQQGQNKTVTVPVDAGKVELVDAWSGGAQTKLTVLEAAAPSASPVGAPTPAVFAATAVVGAKGATPLPSVPVAVTPDLDIHEADLVTSSFDAFFGSPVSTIENLAAEDLVVGHGLTANNIVQGIPNGALPVGSPPDAQTQYEEADKFEVLEVGAHKNGAQATARRFGPNALDHLSLSELRSELKKRGLPASGNRRQLITKLQAAGAL